MNSIWTKCFLALVCAVVVSCERSHPSAQAAENYLDAIKFGDQEQAYRLHVLSTPRSEYCTDAFVRVLEKTRRSATEGACRDLVSYSMEERLRWSDEKNLAYQTFRALCEEPDLNCEGYGGLVFRSSWNASSLTGQTYTIERILGDESRAAIYVSYPTETSRNGRHTLRLKLVGDSWMVTGGLLSDGDTL